jgi:hypothetical protein
MTSNFETAIYRRFVALNGALSAQELRIKLKTPSRVNLQNLSQHRLVHETFWRCD